MNLIPISFLLACITASPIAPSTDILKISSLMHYSVAAYCPSTTHSKSWDCALRVTPALAIVEPKNNFWGKVDRCGDDTTFGNDNLSKFKSSGYGYDGITTTGVFVGYNDVQGKIVVTFKGTDSIQSCVVDAALVFSDGTTVSPAFAGTKLHTGFMYAYNKVRQDFFSGIKEALGYRPNLPIVFTGHSLGGALANIAAVDFVTSEYGKQFIANVEILNFGAPRVGNIPFAQLSQRVVPKHTRIVHDLDVIPSVPPRFLGYEHAGGQIKLSGQFTTMSSFQLSSCDVDPLTSTGESLSCKGRLKESDIMNVLRDMQDGGSFDFGLLLKVGSDLGSDILFGLLNHITNYFGYFTYPPFFPITASFSC